jgi:hypothetical protein
LKKNNLGEENKGECKGRSLYRDMLYALDRRQSLQALAGESSSGYRFTAGFRVCKDIAALEAEVMWKGWEVRFMAFPAFPRCVSFPRLAFANE